MTNAHFLRLAAILVILSSGCINSAPAGEPNSKEVEEDAEEIPSDTYNSLVNFYCSPDKQLSDLKLFGASSVSSSCENKDDDIEFWSEMCRCSVDSRLECPQCSEAQRSIHEAKYDSSTSHKNVPIHIPSPKLANLIIRKTPAESETHSKTVRHGIAANSTNFIRFG